MTDFAKELGNEQNEITEKITLDVKSSEVFDADIRVAIDSQVATAHAYPRNLKKVLENILFLATQDKETAENCFYSIKRDGKTIRGASIRLAEIITACYGNIRASSRIISNDGKMVTAQGMCWDLENNVAFSVEVKRRITDKYGRTFSDDLVVITNNACSSIALRNAIFKVVPMAITSRIQSEIKKIVLGESKDFETTRKNAIEYFVNLGVTEKNILDLFAKKTVQDLDRDDIFDLRGIATAINEGDTTLESAFSVAPKGNTAIHKASKLLSTPIELGNAEYEKTNTAQISFNKEPEKTILNIETKGLSPNTDFTKTVTDTPKEKEIEFGEVTDVIGKNSAINSDLDLKLPKTEEKKDGDGIYEKKKEKKEPEYKLEINSITDAKGNELDPLLYGNIKREELVKTEVKPAITKVADKIEVKTEDVKTFNIEPFGSNEPQVSANVVTDKDETKTEVKKKYKKYKKKDDNKNDNLFDQKND